MNEFKPGDVVIHPEHGRGIVQAGTEGWVEFANRTYWTDALPYFAPDLRRLVVIDPEDREQVERLTKSIVEAAFKHGNLPVAHNGIHGDTIADALREFADPKPPKPEEPTGLGAVVEDDEGSKWVRIESRTGGWWRNSDGGARRWRDVDAVRVLSEGVQP